MSRRGRRSTDRDAVTMWQQLGTNLLLEQERRKAVTFLQEVGFTDAEKKMPSPTDEQLQCLHLEGTRFGSQWCSIELCKRCRRRKWYRPSSSALNSLRIRNKDTQRFL